MKKELEQLKQLMNTELKNANLDYDAYSQDISKWWIDDKWFKFDQEKIKYTNCYAMACYADHLNLLRITKPMQFEKELIPMLRVLYELIATTYDKDPTITEAYKETKKKITYVLNQTIASGESGLYWLTTTQDRKKFLLQHPELINNPDTLNKKISTDNQKSALGNLLEDSLGVEVLLNVAVTNLITQIDQIKHKQLITYLYDKKELVNILIELKKDPLYEQLANKCISMLDIDQEHYTDEMIFEVISSLNQLITNKRFAGMPKLKYMVSIKNSNIVLYDKYANAIELDKDLAKYLGILIIPLIVCWICYLFHEHLKNIHADRDNELQEFLSNKIDPQKYVPRTFHAQLPAQDPNQATQTTELLFTESFVPGDSNCGFTSLKASRDIVTCTLDVKLEDGLINLNELYPEIFDWFQNEQSKPNIKPEQQSTKYSDFQELLTKRNSTQTQLDNFLSELKNTLKNDAATAKFNAEDMLVYLADKNQDQYPTLQEKINLRNQAEVNMKQFCCRKKIYQEYLDKYLAKDGWLGYQSAIVYANSVKKIDLYIWQVNPQDQKSLVRITETKKHCTTIDKAKHILFNEKTKNFSVLEFKTPQLVQQEEPMYKTDIKLK